MSKLNYIEPKEMGRLTFEIPVFEAETGGLVKI